MTIILKWLPPDIGAGKSPKVMITPIKDVIAHKDIGAGKSPKVVASISYDTKCHHSIAYRVPQVSYMIYSCLYLFNDSQSFILK